MRNLFNCGDLAIASYKQLWMRSRYLKTDKMIYELDFVDGRDQMQGNEHLLRHTEMVQSLPTSLTFAEFVAQFGDDIRYELIDGVVEMEPTGFHEQVAGFINLQLNLAIAHLNQLYHKWGTSTRVPPAPSHSPPILGEKTRMKLLFLGLGGHNRFN